MRPVLVIIAGLLLGACTTIDLTSMMFDLGTTNLVEAASAAQPREEISGL